MLSIEYVGFWSTLVKGTAEVGRVSAAIPPLPAPRIDPANFPIASPWSPSDLARLVYEDVFPGERPINSRAAGMRVPAAARGVNFLKVTGCRLALNAFQDGQPVPQYRPGIAYNTGTATSWQLRNAWTIDDLIWYGWSCWWVVRDPLTGFPTAGDRLDQAAWTINDDNKVEVNGVEVPDDQVMLFPGITQGLLTDACDTLRRARRLYEIVDERLESPTPPIDLHQVKGEKLTPDERKELVNSWRTARKAKGGSAVGYTSEEIEVNVLESNSGDQLLIEARNAARLDVANHLGLSASKLDATAPKASLNYETTQGTDQSAIDYDLALYLTPISARLSLDDCVPPGISMEFDLSAVQD
ncbi:conserved hypothetical protein [Aeromicrobium sp. 9AM]|nr:conserved hypothetical protein [Aeromicrobium sp. 9AM]